MSQPPLPFQIEPMRLLDISEVTALEQAAYGQHWSQKDYRHELQSNILAHYVVIRVPHKENRLVAQAGFWLIIDAIHVNTIVVHPDWRHLGLSQWLLLALIEQGQALGATAATLEVRVSNQPAIALYRKFGFREAGRRLRYYSDNGEDALILTTPALALPGYQTLLRQRKADLTRRLANMVDKFDQID